MDATKTDLEFNLTEQEFSDRIEHHEKYPEEGTQDSSPAFNYLQLLLTALSDQLRLILHPELPALHWDENYKVSISHPKEGEEYSEIIPSINSAELVVLNVAETLYLAPIIEAAEMARIENQGMLIIHFDDDDQIEDTPTYKEVARYLAALEELCPSE